MMSSGRGRLAFSVFLLYALIGGIDAAMHTINVGQPMHQFGPDSINAAVNDIVVFVFTSGEHSVVRAVEGDPCIPYEHYDPRKQGFFSGMVEVKTGEPPQKWMLRINDTEPIYFYCSAPGSCDKWKMVGAINVVLTPVLNASAFQHQKDLINEHTVVLQPGEGTPPEGTPQPQPAARHTLSTGAIVGIAVGGTAVLALAAALFFFVGRTKTLEKVADRGSLHKTGHSHTAHHDTMHSPCCGGFEGCAPMKPHDSMPPAYACVSPLGGQALGQQVGMDGGYMRGSMASPVSDVGRMSMWDSPPQEMEGEGGGVHRR